MKNEHEKIQAELLDSKKALKSKSVEVEEVRDMLRDVGNELVEAKDQLKDSSKIDKEELTNARNEIEKLKKDNEAVVSTYRMKHVELTNKIDYLNNELTKFKASSDEQKKQLQESVNNANDIINKLKIENSNITSQFRDYNNLKNATIQKEKTIAYLEKQIKEYTEAKDKLNKEIDIQKKENIQLTNRLGLLKKENQNLHDNESKNSQSFENYLKENGKLSERLSILQEKYDTLQNLKSNSSEQNDTIKRQCEELNIKLKESNKRVISLEDELNDYTNIIQEKTRESETMRRLLADSQNDESSKYKELTDKLAYLTNEKSKLDSELALQSSRTTREIHDWKQANLELKSEMHSLRMREKELLSEIDTLNSLHDQMKRKSVANNEDSGELEKVTTNLKESLANADQKIRDLQASNVELMHLNNDVNKKLERITKNYRTISNQLNALKEGKEIPTRASRSNSAASTMSNHLAVNEPRRSPSSQNLEAATTETELEQNEKIAYIKNVLLGFLEHKEQRTQLLPVVSMLLQLDNTDERRLLQSLD